MRPPAVLAVCCVLLVALSIIHPARTSNRSRWKRERSSAVRFPADGSNSGSKTPWRVKDADVNSLNNRNPKAKFQGAAEVAGGGTRSWRKSEPDVQDIISGIVQLLGAKVNLHAGSSSAGSDASTAGSRPTPVQSTRINNRAPPRVTEVPFEAIPLELGNSGDIRRPPSSPQLPFGVPLRRPFWPSSSSGSGHNVQDLPFASGISLPVQLVPPVSNRPLPLPPNGIPLTLNALNGTTANAGVTGNAEVAANATKRPAAVPPTPPPAPQVASIAVRPSYVTSSSWPRPAMSAAPSKSSSMTVAFTPSMISMLSVTTPTPTIPAASSVHYPNYSASIYSEHVLPSYSEYSVPYYSEYSQSFVPESTLLIRPTLSYGFTPEVTSPVVTATLSSILVEPVPSVTLPPLRTLVPAVSVVEPSMEDVVSTVDAPPVSSTAFPSPSASSSHGLGPSLPNTEPTLSSASPQPEAAYPLPPTVASSSAPEFTPPLPVGRPGQVFSDHTHHDVVGTDDDEVDVITGDDVRPQGAYGETFELVVTANQNFGSYPPSPAPNAPVPGRPHVIPVDIEEIRAPAGVLAADKPTGDQFVSIDGRKTYFNLFPTQAHDGVTSSPPPLVRPTAAPSRFPQASVGSENGKGYVYPTSHGGAALQRPASTGPRPASPYPAPARPLPGRFPVPATPPSSGVRRPTPALIRRPSTTTPVGVIDACIVGDPNACIEPNQSCRKEEDGAVCSCKAGFGRRKSSDSCKQTAGYALSIRVDRWVNERLSWSPVYSMPENPDYQQLQTEANQAIESLMDLTPLASVYVSSSVNKFYSINNKVVVNATVFLQQIPDTFLDSFRGELQNHVANAIRNRNNNIGVSRLFVDGPFSPIPAVQDLNECSSPEYNDCSPDGLCFNSAGSFSCRCRPGFSDPFESDPDKSGRQCNSCTSNYCNNRGECRIENGRKTCACRGNYQGTQCEVDSQVLGVAIGASLAAVVIIILTLVFLCMWSRRWRQNQDKVDRNGFVEQLKSMPFPIMMQDRIRWAQYAEAMAASNLYAQPDPVNVNPHLALISPAYPVSMTGTMASRASMATTIALTGNFQGARSTSGSVISYGKRNAPPPPPSNPPPPLHSTETSEESADESDAPIARPFQVPRPRSRSSAPSQNNIYFEADHPSNEFSASQTQLSLSGYNQRNGGQRYYYR